MTEEQADAAHTVYDALVGMLQEVVNAACTLLTPEQEDYVRMKLNDEMRYWK